MKRELLQPEPSIQVAAWGSREVGAGAVELSISPLPDIVLVATTLDMCGWVVLSYHVPNNLFPCLYGFQTCILLYAVFFLGSAGLKQICRRFLRRIQSLGSLHPS